MKILVFLVNYNSFLSRSSEVLSKPTQALPQDVTQEKFNVKIESLDKRTTTCSLMLCHVICYVMNSLFKVDSYK